jgi:uncharacterized damage-inducible protein DinB
LYDTPLSLQHNLDLLAAAPGRLAELSAGLTAQQLLQEPAPGEWSMRDVLGHLRACSDMWGQSIQTILDQDHPTFKAINPTNWIRRTDYLQQDFQPSLQAFTAQRTELLAILKQLSPDAWSRAATVTGAGRPIQRTVQTYALWLANHERSHFRQLERIASSLRA